jgi:UDP-N-acetylglucosamine/UDP-N-acetylgalactosamine diphosphorylase
MNKENDLESFLRMYHQEHLLELIKHLSAQEKARLKERILFYGKNILKMQQHVLFEKSSTSLQGAFCPSCEDPSPLLVSKGWECLKNGKVACLLLAGGQGTRLGFDGPKGMFPVSPITHKTLFQLIFEKIDVLSKKLHAELQVAVMVSSQNEVQTKEYLIENQFFGVSPRNVKIVCQDDLPLISSEGKWALDPSKDLAVGPDGNGRVFAVLEKNGVLKDWRLHHVDWINVIQIDNPLADPFDAALIGQISSSSYDVCLRVVEREDPEEKVGVVAAFPDGIKIAEYSDLSLEQRSARDPSGRLQLPYANTGQMIFSLSFIEDHMNNMADLPWHLAYKQSHLWSIDLGCYEEKIWKFETFIFDLFSFSRQIGLLKSERKDCYSPLKNATGDKCIQSVQRDLLYKYKKLYQQASGLVAEERDFELDASFWYLTENVMNFWRGRLLPKENYIEAQVL